MKTGNLGLFLKDSLMNECEIFDHSLVMEMSFCSVLPKLNQRLEL